MCAGHHPVPEGRRKLRGFVEGRVRRGDVRVWIGDSRFEYVRREHL